MGFRHSMLGRVLASISKHGIATGVRDSLARWSRSQLKAAHDVTGDFGWVLTPDRPPALPVPAHRPLRINWLLSNMAEASGGGLGITRAIYHLERLGHQHRIYITGRSRLSAERATAIARSYYPIKAQVEIFDGKVADSDALVATLWTTAYIARGLPNTARKFYFVQDLEYLFYPQGSLFEFARQTYQWGFHGIVLGQWIADVLSREFHMECSTVGFAYDRETYSVNGSRRLPPGKKRVLFYARPATERRGFELGLLALSLVAKKKPDAEFVLIGAPLRRSEVPFPAILPGVVPQSELAPWYRSCTAGLVLSHTNMSLVPLELMACGCVVVSNSGPNVECLLNDRIAQLTDPTPEAVAGAILALLQDGELHARKSAAAVAFAQSTDIMHETRKIESAFYQGLHLVAPVSTTSGSQLQG